MSHFPTGLSSSLLTLSRRSAFRVLLLIGVALAAAFLLDIYMDWAHQGDQLWSTALENLVPILLSLIPPYIGWRLFQGSHSQGPHSSFYLPEAAKYALAGAVGLALLAGLVVGLQVLQGEVKPVLIALQLATAGALGGLYVGCSIAQLREAKQEAQEDRGRLENLLDGLPVPVVHGRLEGKEVSILTANDAFEEVFGRAAGEPAGENLQDLTRPTDSQVDTPEGPVEEGPVEKGPDQEAPTQESPAAVQRRAIEEGVAETKVRCMTTGSHQEGSHQEGSHQEGSQQEEGQQERGQREFQLRVARALDSGASETYSVYTDITEQKRREETIENRRQKIEALYRATSGLFSIENQDAVPDRILAVLEEVFDFPLAHVGLVEDGVLEPKKTVGENLTRMPKPQPQPLSADLAATRAIRSGEAAVVQSADGLKNDLDYGTLSSLAGIPIAGHGAVVLGQEQGSFDPFNLRLLEVLTSYAALALERLDREERLVRAREEAEVAREEAEEAARLKSAMLANMSHEIRTPLTSIIGFAEAIGTELSELELPGGSPLPKYADLIEQGGKRLLETLEGVLNLSKLEAGQMELSAETVDLPEQARRAAEELRAKAEEKGVGLEVETGPASAASPASAAPPVTAEADEGSVQIALRNLLSNAIKYTEEGSVQVRTYQEDTYRENSQEESRKEEGRKKKGKENGVAVATEAGTEVAAAVLEVKDTGIGMDPEMAEDLFEPFRQASEGLSREYEGTGIGLAVTREAVEQMGGTIEVDTEEGEGTRVTVRLPLAEKSEAT